MSFIILHINKKLSNELGITYKNKDYKGVYVKISKWKRSELVKNQFFIKEGIFIKLFFMY